MRRNIVGTVMAGLLAWSAHAAEPTKADEIAATDGAYLLTLQHARLGTPVQVWMDCKDGRPIRSFAVATWNLPHPLPVDVSRLAVTADRARGELDLTWPAPLPGPAGKLGNKQTYAVDLAAKDGYGIGPYKGGGGDKATPPCELAEIRRVDVVTTSPEAHWELVIPDALDSRWPPRRLRAPIAARFTTRSAKAIGVRAYACLQERSDKKDAPALAAEDPHAAAALNDSTISGSFAFPFPEGEPAYRIDFKAQVIGPRLAGTATVQRGDTKWTTSAVGIASAAGQWHQSPTPKQPAWTWSYTAKPDPALVAEARAQAQEPLFPGDPKGREFWSWRELLRKGWRISCIHPPSFDFRPIPGAAKYRYALVGKGGNEAKSYTCEVDQPWRPLTALWKDLPFGEYAFTVIGLGPDGKKLAEPIKMHWWAMRAANEIPEEERKWKVPYGKVKRDYKGKEIVDVPKQPITIVKRGPFDGPYFQPHDDVPRAVLRAARWARGCPTMPEWRGLTPHLDHLGTIGNVEHLFRGGGYCQMALVCAALSDDPHERAESLLLADAGGNCFLNGRHGDSGGLVGNYHNFTANRVWDYQLLSALGRALHGEKYDTARLELVKTLVALQRPDGSFAATREHGAIWVDPAGWHMPEGVFAIEIDRFNPATLLYLLGRARHELKTEQFVENEKRAMGYILKNLDGEFFWPEHGPHSLTAAYPTPVHGHIVQYLLLYLLDYARPEDRDLKLIEHLALWCEDRNIDWTRVETPSEKIHPTAFGSADGGRSGGDPAENLARMAHIYAKLWRATGRPLHRAKAEALLGAVLAGQCPESGQITMDTAANVSTDPRSILTFQMEHPAIRMSFVLWNLLAAGEALQAPRAK
jgi:hypothetical protein